jgi:hypothetical protein
MKNVFIITILLFGQMACKSDDSQDERNDTSKQDERNDTSKIAKIQELGKKYGIDVTIDEKATAMKKEGVSLTLEQIEAQFKMVADQKKQFAEEKKQIEALNEEVKSRKTSMLPNEYLKTLEKYPLVKQQVITQMGGNDGFEKYKKRLLAKDDSIVRLLKNNLKVK